MQRMYNFDKWMNLGDGQGLRFAGNRPRQVRLEVNAPQETRLYVEDDDDTGVCNFLALVKGRDTIEWSASGAFILRADGGDVSIYTADGADISLELEAPVSFTKIVERRKRNPELEQVLAVLNRTMEERIAQATREIERRQASREQPGRMARSLPSGTAFNANQGVPGDGQPGARSGDETGPGASGGAPGAPGGGREGEPASGDDGAGKLRRGSKKAGGPPVSENGTVPEPTDAS